MISEANQGLLFVVSAPSGVGKTTIIRAVQETWPQLRYSISSTTRAPRTGEREAVDYHFVTRQEFLGGIRTGRFVEWAEVHGEFYGTDGQQVDKWLAEGKDVLLDIDIQGARQVRCAYPTAITIFILPPSIEELKARLENRGTESEDQVARRLSAAQLEILEAPWYDYLVLNEMLHEAIADFNAILRACRCARAHRAAQLRDFLLPREPH
jgi:guanylate kinase